MEHYIPYALRDRGLSQKRRTALADISNKTVSSDTAVKPKKRKVWCILLVNEYSIQSLTSHVFQVSNNRGKSEAENKNGGEPNRKVCLISIITQLDTYLQQHFSFQQTSKSTIVSDAEKDKVKKVEIRRTFNFPKKTADPTLCLDLMDTLYKDYYAAEV